MEENLITERVKRELQTIQFLFEMQLGKDFNEAKNVFLMPGELATEPRYILNFDFLLTKSDGMFDFIAFKSQIINGYKTPIAQKYLIKELNDIAEKCREVISLNDELNNSDIKKLTGSSKEHNAIVEIYDYDISIVYLGLKFSEYWDKDNKAFFPTDIWFFLDYVDEVFTFVMGLLPQQTENAKRKKPYEEYDWFKVGLKFADGTIKQQAGRSSYKEITINAGLNATLRPYVSATFGTPTVKNIFANEKYMRTIHKHCISNEIPISDWFLEEFKKYEQ